MAINLSSYTNIQSNLFVRLVVEQYSTTAGGPYTNQVLRFSDKTGSTTIEGETYTGLGNLLGVSSVSSELRVSGYEVVVSISGIPDTSIAEILNSRIKGSSIKIYRAFFEATTGNILSISGNPMGRFQGFVNNVSLTEDFNVDERDSSNILTLQCASVVDILAKKISGRRTNPTSQKQFFPNDVSMDRVPSLENYYVDFGVKK